MSDFQATVPPNYQSYTSGAAILSLLFGVAAWTVLPVAGAIVAVVCGHLARSTIRTSGGVVQGDALALAGLIMGWLQLAIVSLFFSLVIALVVYAFSHGNDWLTPLHGGTPARGQWIRALHTSWW